MSVFEMLGDKENDITFSLGWALSKCTEFRQRIVGVALSTPTSPLTDTVLLQEHGDEGVTDIEIKGPAVHIIIEAKRGFEIPGTPQLERYASRLRQSSHRNKAILTVSEASREYASSRLPERIADVPCSHMSLTEIDNTARLPVTSHANKRLLQELSVYLNRIARMQNIESNIVYVVALSGECPRDSSVSWKDMVEVHNMYIHPVGNSYPREPVNYVGFRYGGQLRHIRHVNRSEVIDGVFDKIPGCRYQMECPYYLYHLGAPIIPSKVVKNGKTVMANRVYAAIDLLLTCDTISDAGEQTRKRRSE